MSSTPTTRAGGRTRRRRGLAVFAVLLIVLAALGLLAIPFLSVPGDASAAKRELTGAMSALRSGDLRAAREQVTRAREHVDSAQESVQGIGGDVWSRIPFLGTPVADARHLVQALDDATSVAEIGLDVYPSVAGQQATLFSEGQLDEQTLDRVITAAQDAGAHLTSASDELDEVRASTPVVGDTIAARRDEAAAQVTPMAEAFAGLEPMLDDLPAVFGFEGQRAYLIAMLNPAELRYSGGAALSFASMTWDEGKLEVGETVGVQEEPRLSQEVRWKKVFGNRFHRGNTRVANSTFAPSWSVSGKELVRAWRSALGEGHDGVMAVDVVAMAKVLEVTGPVTTPGYGELTADNLVERLVGSYDDYYPDATVQDQYNAEVIGAFQGALFGGGDYMAKAQALGKAADERHLALYFQDPDVQEGFAALGMDGDLAEPAGDYLGVFTQSNVGSKVDYWQRRSVSLEVELADDGSASNQLDVAVHNDTPPYVASVPDPRSGYFTRWSNLSASVFVPDGASIEGGAVRGEPWDPTVRNFYSHDFVASQMVLEPASTGELQLSYEVPDAATVDDSGNLTYRLAIDPQGTVIPQSAEITVQLPDGYRATELPEGWTSNGGTLSFATEAFEASTQWEIRAEPSN